MANEHTVTLGAVLRRQRVAARLTQEQLAARAGLSTDEIAALEHGRRRSPRPATMHQLAAALALSGAEREALLAAAWPPVSAPLARRGASVWTVANRLTLPPVAQPTPLIGRTTELASIRRRLVGDGAEGARVLTLTGPAGVGK